MASTTDHVDRASTHPRRRARVSRFLRILVAITAAMHVPVALGVGELARRCGWPAAPLVGWAWAATGVVLFVGRARAGMPDRRRPAALVRAVDVPYFIHWCAALWALIPSVVATIVAPAVEAVLGQHVRLPVAGYMYFYLSGLVVAGYGTLVRRRWVRVVEREVPLAGLDARLDGTRIAHLSDLHVGTLTPRAWGLSWSAKANLCRPDLAVVTGDMLTSGTDFHEDVADVVGALRAKHGVFSSMGNHDYFGEGETLAAKLRQRDVTVLRNEGVVLEREGSRLWLAAIDDVWTRRDDVTRAMAGRPAGVAAILLAHDPKSFDAAADAGADLVLSGHTHGGQVAVPFLARSLNLARIAYRYSL